MSTFTPIAEGPPNDPPGEQEPANVNSDGEDEIPEGQRANRSPRRGSCSQILSADELVDSPPQPNVKRAPRPSNLKAEVLLDHPKKKSKSKAKSAGKIRVPPLSTHPGPSLETGSPTTPQLASTSAGKIRIPQLSTLPLTRASISKPQEESEPAVPRSRSERATKKKGAGVAVERTVKRGGTVIEGGRSNKVSPVSARTPT